MKTVYACLIACIFTACATTQTGSQSTREARSKIPLKPAERAEIDAIEEIGHRLFRHDHASAIANDLLLEQIDSANYPDFAGWISIEEGDQMKVLFFHGPEADLKVLADITLVPEQKPTIVIKPDRAITAKERTMFLARQAGLRAGVNNCSQRFNTVVFPESGGQYHVYVLAATTDPSALLVGGHTKVVVAADGATVISKENYSKSCLTLDKSGGDLPPDVTPMGLIVTHVVSPYPAPTHVFLSLQHRTVLYVATERGNWSVNGSEISFMK